MHIVHCLHLRVFLLLAFVPSWKHLSDPEVLNIRVQASSFCSPSVHRLPPVRIKIAQALTFLTQISTLEEENQHCLKETSVCNILLMVTICHRNTVLSSYLVFAGQAPAVCGDSSILLLHVGLDLSVLSSLLLFT